MAELAVSADLDAPAVPVWNALTDWDVHDRWMLGTRATGGHGVGATIEAFTGIGRIGFLDTMTIVVWEPPHRAVVRHTGRVVRGSGSFVVHELPGGRSRVVWSEWIALPLGLLGRLGWPLLRPLVRASVRLSLRRLERYVRSGR
ncbi:MAG: SRPBCC family protein [Actinomycetes bacterium]